MREGGLQQKLKQLTKNNAMIILDGDNIRGKTRFKLSKEGKNVEGKQNVSHPFPTGFVSTISYFAHHNHKLRLHFRARRCIFCFSHLKSFLLRC
jgi:hypothetical protein